DGARRRRRRGALSVGAAVAGGGGAATYSHRPMSLTVVGSIAFDAVKTPFGERERMLGGAATAFALAASAFAKVRVVGGGGADLRAAEDAILQSRGIVTDDIERVPGGKTFFWKGEYHYDLNSRDTLDTQLNVFESFEPKLSQASREA